MEEEKENVREQINRMETQENAFKEKMRAINEANDRKLEQYRRLPPSRQNFAVARQNRETRHEQMYQQEKREREEKAHS